MEWISTAQLAADSVRLAGMLPENTARIVGIPRSGMIPASIIAAHLHLPLWELTGGHLRRLAIGSRGFDVHDGIAIVIDDTVYSGNAIRSARAQMRDPAKFATIYIRPDQTGAVDYYVRAVDHRSHLLEWNFFNNHAIYRAGVAMDFDGILCEEPPVPDADGGAVLDRYRQWLTEARPLWLPRAQPVRLIATGRLERWRAETEAWLQKWGVRFERLAMYPANCASQRGDVALFKAEEYGRSATAYFLESCVHQSARIHELSRKQVICPRAGKVWG